MTESESLKAKRFPRSFEGHSDKIAKGFLTTISPFLY
jgi:hypothetical protein